MTKACGSGLGFELGKKYIIKNKEPAELVVSLKKLFALFHVSCMCIFSKPNVFSLEFYLTLIYAATFVLKLIIRPNFSASNEAPPTSAPSMSG